MSFQAELDLAVVNTRLEEIAEIIRAWDIEDDENAFYCMQDIALILEIEKEEL